jgi:long-subunit acyl-CoA synthetase (AMP-forming)
MIEIRNLCKSFRRPGEALLNVLDEVDFSVDEGELTPTMKLKRRVVVEKYRAELDTLY